jgi:hypothetical protein
MSQSVYPPVVNGPLAVDDPVAGNPIAMGGRSSTAVATAVGADGDVQRVWLTRNGAMVVAVAHGATAVSDGVASTALMSDRTNNSWPLGVDNFVFNGTNWDRQRGDTLGTHISRSATAATATLSNVAGSASSVTLLALNAARKGATIYNDSSAILYLKLGATASTTSYTVQVAGGGYYEVPFGYTGVIDGLWASATGDARITELS